MATVAAVLAAPGFLSGLSDDDLAVIRQRRSQTAAKANPKLHRRQESLRTARQRIEWVRESLDKARVRSFGGAPSAQRAA